MHPVEDEETLAKFVEESFLVIAYSREHRQIEVRDSQVALPLGVGRVGLDQTLQHRMRSITQQQECRMSLTTIQNDIRLQQIGDGEVAFRCGRDLCRGPKAVNPIEGGIKSRGKDVCTGQPQRLRPISTVAARSGVAGEALREIASGGITMNDGPQRCLDPHGHEVAEVGSVFQPVLSRRGMQQQDPPARVVEHEEITLDVELSDDVPIRLTGVVHQFFKTPDHKHGLMIRDRSRWDRLSQLGPNVGGTARPLRA